MVSFAVKHEAVVSSGSMRTVHASRRKGAANGHVLPTLKLYGIAMSYLIDEANGGVPAEVNVVFPDAKYNALDYVPVWTGYRFLGWFDSATGGAAVSKGDQVAYGRPVVYAHWQNHETVEFDAATNGGVMPSGWTAPYYFAGQPYGTLPTPIHQTMSFGGWYDAGGNRVTAASVVPVGGATLTARYVAASFAVDMNSGAWEIDASLNPDASAYAGVYRSTNVGGDDTMAKMYVDVMGYTSFRVLLASSSEESYDYAVAMESDVDPEEIPYVDPWWGGGGTTEGVKAHTATGDYCNADPSDAGQYQAVDYALDGGTHRICILYRKDSSVASGDDRGYVLIPYVQGGA